MQSAVTAVRAGLCAGAMLIAAPAIAQDAPSPEPTADREDDEQAYPELLAGTLGVSGDLEEDSTPRTSLTNSRPDLPRWFDFKRRFEDRTGIKFGGS